VSYELRLLKLFLRCRQFVSFVRCELRLEKHLRTTLFCVTMKHVRISYQSFGTTDFPILTFGFLTPKDETDSL